MKQLCELPHSQALELSQSGAPIYVLVNPIEYHGPHLSLYTDRMLSLGLTQKLHSLLAQEIGEHPLLIGADIQLGVDPAPGPGSMQTKYAQLHQVLQRLTHHLVKLEAKKVIFMTFHGAPLHNLAIYKAIEKLRSHNIAAINPLHKVLNGLLDYQADDYQELAPLLPADERENVLAHLNQDFHAGLFETSLCLYLAPATVAGHQQVPPCPPLNGPSFIQGLANLAAKLGAQKLSHELEFMRTALAWIKLRPQPGHTGQPHLATREIGQYFTEKRILPMYVEEAKAVLWGEQAPMPPMMPWVHKLTLGGRLAP